MDENVYVVSDPYAPPRSGGAARLEPDRGRHVMTLGIVGAVFLGLFPIVSIIVGAIGWSRAAADLRKMEQGLMAKGPARAMTRAGLILGKVSVIVAPFAILFWILYIALLVASRPSFHF